MGLKAACQVHVVPTCSLDYMLPPLPTSPSTQATLQADCVSAPTIVLLHGLQPIKDTHHFLLYTIDQLCYLHPLLPLTSSMRGILRKTRSAACLFLGGVPSWCRIPCTLFLLPSLT